MTTALVTGATGFIGLLLCERLQSEGVNVIALGRKSRPGPWHEFIEIDFENQQTWPVHLPQVDEIYHLASKAHLLGDQEPPQEVFEQVALDGQAYLLRQIHHPERVRYLFCSTVKAMGESTPAGVALDEESVPSPVSPYGRAKLKAEQQLRADKRLFLSKSIVRPVAVYGKGQRGNLDRMEDAIKRGHFPPLPQLNNRRSFIHVADLVSALILVQRVQLQPSSETQLYLACEERAVSTTELYESICLRVGKKPPALRVPYWLLRLLAMCGDLGEKVIRRSLPFNTSQLLKLTASAWYMPKHLAEIGFQARHHILDQD
jgi:UDP-glucose 4-epimerase